MRPEAPIPRHNRPIENLAVVPIVAGLLFAATFVRRVPGTRTALLRGGMLAIFANTVLDAAEQVDRLPIFDIGKRIWLTLLQLAGALLILTFRGRPIGRRLTTALCGVAALVCCAQVVLGLMLPVGADGRLVDKEALQGVPVAVGYFGVQLATFAATTVFVGVAVLRVAVRREQPVIAQISLGLLLLAFLVNLGATGLSFASIATPEPHREPAVDLYLVAIVLVCAGLAVAGARRLFVASRDRILADVTVRIVRPVWEAVTQLRPEVVLPRDAPDELDMPDAPLDEAARLVVEAHDAITLIVGADGASDATGDGPSAIFRALSGRARMHPVAPFDRVLLQWSARPADPLRGSIAELADLRDELARRA